MIIQIPYCPLIQSSIRHYEILFYRKFGTIYYVPTYRIFLFENLMLLGYCCLLLHTYTEYSQLREKSNAFNFKRMFSPNLNVCLSQTFAMCVTGLRRASGLHHHQLVSNAFLINLHLLFP